MASVSSAYDSLQRVLAPKGPRSPVSPSSGRKPIPAFTLDPPSLPLAEESRARRRVVDASLSWWDMKTLVELEYAYKGRAPLLLDGKRIVLEAGLKGTSITRGSVEVSLLSDSVLVGEENGDTAPTLVQASSITVADSTLHILPKPSSPALPVEQIRLFPSSALSSSLALFSAALARLPPSPPPLSPLSPATAWTPDVALAMCECCETVRFNTLTQRKHHCRVCGRGICGRCSRWMRPSGESEGEKKVRVCKECFSR